MTHEGRMARGKANFEAGELLDNSETNYYLDCKAQEGTKAKPKEAKKDAKPAK